jgi:peptide alpha-N-acetyltransferase
MRSADRLGKNLFDKSLIFINKAIDHTPTVIELYIHKAKIYQRLGDPEKAAALTEEARNLDLADRYLNAHSSKYLLKANKVRESYNNMVLFSKD